MEGSTKTETDLRHCRAGSTLIFLICPDMSSVLHSLHVTHASLMQVPRALKALLFQLLFSSSVQVINEAQRVLLNIKGLFKRSQDFNPAIQIQIVKFTPWGRERGGRGMSACVGLEGLQWRICCVRKSSVEVNTW